MGPCFKAALHWKQNWRYKDVSMTFLKKEKLFILRFLQIFFRFGDVGVEFYGQCEKDINICNLYFIPGQVCRNEIFNNLLFSINCWIYLGPSNLTQR